MLRNSLDAGAASRFQVLDALGTGGFGAVHAAIDLRTEQRVALKYLGNTTASSIAHFKHEFRALAGCHHPNLVALKELIEEGGQWIIVMELVPGSNLRDYVRGQESAGFHEGRLRSAFSGVVEGLRALHGFGFLHRDLKPSNVRVRPDGRAVLLDFGLATSIHELRESAEILGGTVRYMAPEQASGGQLGPAADVYALGVCLFEALTGTLPFDGEQAIAILQAKQASSALAPSERNPAVPRDLDRLCVRMLALDPDQRPALDEVLSVLSGDEPTSDERHESPAFAEPQVELFAGREQELDQLERALNQTRRGELRIVLIEGESGVGKSELVAEFSARALARHPRLITLRGRCYENEQVSYKAFDGCIDELAKLMARMGEKQSAALLPLRAHLLAQLFPVLRNIRAIARAPREATSADLGARRLEAFGAVAGLFAQLADDRPLVLVVDDLQWADAESFRLLQALVAASPPPPLLLLATIRPDGELEPEVLTQVAAVRALRTTEVVQVAGLPPVQARALASKLLGRDAAPVAIAAVAEESSGHPLLLRELAQYARTRGLEAPGNVSLEAALGARIEPLEVEQRTLLELASLAARPYGTHVFARAMEVDEVEEPARQLLAAKLLRVRKGHELGCYHDRIRRTVAELLSPARAMELHRKLAIALATSADNDPVEQARHWDLAGDAARAVEAYERAAIRAGEALAFSRVAQLCARALELASDPHGDQGTAQRLLVLRAHALACLGHSGEAADLYARAADACEGETRIRLRSRSAQQLILSGNIAGGFAAARALLRELGVSVPLGSLAIARLLWDRLCLALSGIFPARTRSLDPRRAMAIDVIDELTHVVWLAHPVTMVTLSLQQVRLALGQTSRERSALADTTLGWLFAVTGAYAKSAPLFERSRAQIEGSRDAPRRAMQAFIEGSARIAGFDWAGGSACLQRALQIAQEHCPDWPWLTTNIRYHLGTAWYHLGEHRRLAQQTESWLAEAREQNNTLAVALFTGMGHGLIRHLVGDQPERAEQESAQALKSISAEPYSFVHFGHFMGMCFTLMYRGGPDAFHFIEAYKRRHARAALLKSPMPREVLRSFEQSARLHAYRTAGESERKAHLRACERLARQLRRASPLLLAYSNLTLAQVRALEGRRLRALVLARLARAQFEAMGHYAQSAAMFLEGLLEGGARGQEKQSNGLAFFEKQGWRAPHSALSMAMPVLPLLLASEGARGSDRSSVLASRYETGAKHELVRSGAPFEARDVHTGRRVLVQQLPVLRGELRLQRELDYRAVRTLAHPQLARVEGTFAHGGRDFLAVDIVQGSDLLAYARPHGRADATRIAATLLGAARALEALHELGLAHGSVSVENIRVAGDGRVVLIGLGTIARDAVDGAGESAKGRDIRALGLCLHEALFGLRGDADNTQTISRDGETLRLLARRMLDTSPSERPSASDLVELLSAGLGRPSLDESRTPSVAPAFDLATFTGRREELATIASAFERTCDGFTLVLIEGESGSGSSALMAEFARRMDAGYPSLRVLIGRCYETEQLPYNAFDGAVEQLARLLRSYSNPECEALLPPRAALLAQLFPALASVPAIAAAAKSGLPADPLSRKLAARGCFVALLEKLSEKHELMLAIDDLQWADAESFALLEALLEQRERLPLLCIATVRPRSELDAQVAERVAELCRDEASERVLLSGLDAGDARVLAEKIAPEAAPERLEAAIAASKGQPLALRELLRYERGLPDAREAQLTRDEALRAQVAELDEGARALLGLVALSGRPLPAHVYARALGRQELARADLTTLVSGGLLGRRGEDELTCAHDRTRRFVLGLLDETERRRLACALAAALEATGAAPPAERARLWEAAGETLRALAAFRSAGELALENFAFGRAEQDFAHALALLDASAPNDDEQRLALLALRGEALVRAGRSAEAASCFELAVPFAQGEQRVRLRMRAAQQLLQSAQVEPGLHATKELLEELGLTLPRGDRAALARIGYERFRIALQSPRAEASRAVSSPEQRLVLETLHGLSAPVRAVTYLPGSALVMQYLSRALKTGDPAHSARAIAFEALYRALRSPEEDQAPRFARSEALAERAGDRALQAELALLRGVTCLARGDMAEAPPYLVRAQTLLATECPGEPWLLTGARMYLGFIWSFTGDYGALSRDTPMWCAEARERHDRYALAALAGLGGAVFRHLVDDDPSTALGELHDALAPWPHEPFSTLHMGAFFADGMVRHYRRDPALLAWVDAQRTRHARAHLMRSPIARIAVDVYGALGVLHALAETRGADRSVLMQRAREQVRLLQQNPAPVARGFATLMRGLLAALRQDRVSARRRFARATAELSATGSSWALGALYLEGLLEGGEGGRAKRERLLGVLRAEGWSDLERALHMRVPGLALLE